MANDPMFSNAAPEGKPPEVTPATPVAVTPEQIAEVTAPIVSQVTQLAEQVSTLAEHVGSLKPPAPAAPITPAAVPEVKTDFYAEMQDDAEGAIQRRIDNRLKEQMQPIGEVLGSINNSAHDAFVGMEANRIESEWGVGSYQKFFVKPLRTIFDQYRTVNPSLLSKHDLIRKEFDAISGQVVNDLITHRDEARKTVAEKANADLAGLTEGIGEAVTARVGMTGGIKMIGAKVEVSDSLKEFLSERHKSTGVTETPEQFVARTSYDNTLEGFLANKKTLEEAS